MNWNWFKKSKSNRDDKFRIQVVTLQDGSKKYYPQYKNSDLSSSWLTGIVTNNNNVVLVDLSQFDLINSNYHHQTSDQEAMNVVNILKDQLKTDRAKEFSSDEIIKID